jgi:hypothetical protein
VAERPSDRPEFGSLVNRAREGSIAGIEVSGDARDFVETDCWNDRDSRPVRDDEVAGADAYAATGDRFVDVGDTQPPFAGDGRDVPAADAYADRVDLVEVAAAGVHENAGDTAARRRARGESAERRDFSAASIDHEDALFTNHLQHRLNVKGVRRMSAQRTNLLANCHGAAGEWTRASDATESAHDACYLQAIESIAPGADRDRLPRRRGLIRSHFQAKLGRKCKQRSHFSYSRS